VLYGACGKTHTLSKVTREIGCNSAQSAHS